MSSINLSNDAGDGKDSTGVPLAYGKQADKFERFEAWLRENGAQFDMLELREYSPEEDTITSPPPTTEDETSEEKKEPTTTTRRRHHTPSTASSFSRTSNDGNDDNDGDDDGDDDLSSEMRGVHSKLSIPPNTVCVSVPRKCLITVEMGQATEMGRAILNSDLELDAPKHIFLMVYLLWDRKVNGSKSFFKPYYDILPQTLKNMPIFWTDEELTYLEGSYLLAQIADRNDAIEDDYHAICEVAPELASIATLEEFKWARMCVCSRNFGLQIDGNRTSALVPYADMLNHYRPRETKWTFDDDKQAFTITSLQTISRGAQVYDSYGQKCNHRFLLNYGFAVEDNREVDGFCPNEVPIELSIPTSDPLFDAKYEFWTHRESTASNASSIVHHLASAMANPSLHIPSSTQPPPNTSISTPPLPTIKRVRVCVSNNENTRILFSMLRVIVADEAQLRAITTSPGTTTFVSGTALSRHVLGLTSSSVGGASPINHASSPSAALYRTCRDVRCPISFSNERAAMKHLQGVTAQALQGYPTSYEQDVEDLEDETAYPRFSNKRHAKIQVRGEKEVLLHFSVWARTALKVMDVIERELNGEVNGDDTMSFEEIIRTLEDDEEKRTHVTIVRYCADVLDALRREEKKRRRRQLLHVGVAGGANNGTSRYV